MPTNHGSFERHQLETITLTLLLSRCELVKSLFVASLQLLTSRHQTPCILNYTTVREYQYQSAYFLITIWRSSIQRSSYEIQGWLLCLPTPLTLVCGVSPIILLLVHQPAYLSIWPAAPSLQRGLSTNPGVTV